jgi:hypothetical protein
MSLSMVYIQGACPCSGYMSLSIVYVYYGAEILTFFLKIKICSDNFGQGLESLEKKHLILFSFLAFVMWISYFRVKKQ